MPKIARVKKDTAKGIIQGPGSSSLIVDNQLVSLLGDTVAAHGKAPHSKPVLASNGAEDILVDGKIPSKTGTIATCRHEVDTGSNSVIVR